jgi:hypothetical protein
MLLRFVLAAALLAAAGADTDKDKGARYTSDDLTAAAPGPEWRLQKGVPGAANVRAAYILPRTHNGKDASSLITFAIDPSPVPADPLEYLKAAMGVLKEPPLSFKERKSGPFDGKKGMPGARVDYTDRDSIRIFTQIALKTPTGGILVVAVQSPDGTLYANDLTALLSFVDGLEVRAKR